MLMGRRVLFCAEWLRGNMYYTGAMAKTYRPYVPEQDLLLPPSPRDWLPEGHLAFFVSDLVEQLDLSRSCGCTKTTSVATRRTTR